jgi:hypothetical protein
MSSCGEPDVVMATGQRKPTLLRGCSTRRPVQDVEQNFIAAVKAGEIHGQIAGSGVQHPAELRPEPLGGVVIGVTPQGYVSVLSATPRNGDHLLGRGVQFVRAAASEIMVDDRIAYHHTVNAGRRTAPRGMSAGRNACSGHFTYGYHDNSILCSDALHDG